jgi:hypothetical protein
MRTGSAVSACALIALGMAFLWPGLSSSGGAAPTEDQPGSQKDEGKSLWDGKSLDRWQAVDYFKAGKVYVQAGMLVLERGKVMTGVRYTAGDLPKMDYELNLDAQKIAGEDFFCTITFPVADSHCSFVVGGWGGQTVGLSSIDHADASENETSRSKEFQTKRWYHIRIRVSQSRIEVWIDREKMVDLNTTDRKISTRIECNACKPLGIATYMTTGAVRNIRLRTLTEAEKKTIADTKPEKKE